MLKLFNTKCQENNLIYACGRKYYLITCLNPRNME